MTGEITLRGRVLPIGGVKEKVLGALRAGITEVILPKENEPDLEDLPEEARKRIEVYPGGGAGRGAGADTARREVHARASCSSARKSPGTWCRWRRIITRVGSRQMAVVR